MCGRFTLIRLEDFLRDLPWIGPPEQALPAQYNIAPSQPIAVVANLPRPVIDFYHWGLVPHWAKDRTIGNRMINARAETLAEKPAFRTPLRHRRCLVPADGFFEWRKEPTGRKTPMYIRLKSHIPLAFAGLWDSWHSPDGSELRTCTIITTAANDLLKTIHDRMPVILKPESYKEWLSPEEKMPDDLDALQELLTSYPASEMEATPVGTAVNSAKNGGPNCIDSPAAPPDIPADQASKELQQPTLFDM